MKNNAHIQNAIDESLGSVRFTHQDMHAVLTAVRSQRTPENKRKPLIRMEFAAAAAMLVLIAAPLGAMTLRALRAQPVDIVTAAHTGETEETAFAPAQDILAVADLTPILISEGEAIRAARACFDAQCDTAVFTFEEYTVSTSLDSAQYVVSMQSIYDNGCSFQVVVSGADGSVISHSDPEQATMPARLDSNSAEVQAWLNKYGRRTFMWPLDVQAEFSRRYTGADVRMPHEGETPPDVIVSAAKADAETLGYTLSGGTGAFSAYAVLYDGKAFPDGRARYQVYCFPVSIAADGALPESCLVITYLTDGAFDSSKIIDPSGL